MKVRAILGALAVAALAASAATAAPPAGKGKKPTTGAGCKPAVAVILTGTLTADGAVGSRDRRQPLRPAVQGPDPVGVGRHHDLDQDQPGGPQQRHRSQER